MAVGRRDGAVEVEAVTVACFARPRKGGPLALHVGEVWGRGFLDRPSHFAPLRQVQPRGVAGISLSEEDVARLQPECGSDSPSHVDARFDVGLRGYNFGQLRNEVILAGSYEVCWCQPAEYDDVFCNTSSDFKAHFGSVHVMCQVGFVSKGGVCDECHLFILVPNEARTRCELDVGALAQVITSMVLAAIALSIFLAQLEVLCVLAAQRLGSLGSGGCQKGSSRKVVGSRPFSPLSTAILPTPSGRQRESDLGPERPRRRGLPGPRFSDNPHQPEQV